MAEDFANISYNDLDLIFSVDLTTGKAYERVKAAVLDSLLELLPEGVSRKRMSSFPPSENSETTQVLVEIHRANSKIDLDQTGTGREGAKSVSPCRSFISLLGVARAKKACSQWKSSTDIFKESQG